MSRLFQMLIVACGVFAATSGCAHTQLRWNTTHQARTLTDIYEQQVLDNLARFVHDPGALPSFAYPNAGGSDITDQGSLGNDTTWNLAGFSTNVLKLSGSRGAKEAWTLTPVYDVRRLELMRCAYQHSIFCAGLSSRVSGCPDCNKLQRAFYLGDPDGTYDDCADLDHLGTFSNKTGRTTPACFASLAWLGCGKRKLLPRNCDCLKSGHYCGTYVWVLPNGQDELTKLTLVVLDYAFSAQATKGAKKTKEVIWYFNAQGFPTTKDVAAQEIKATVPMEAAVRLGSGNELPLDSKAADGVERLKKFDESFKSFDSSTPSLPPILPPPQGFFPLQFELNRQFLTPQPYPNVP